LDPDNPVVKLCAAGMQAEAIDRFDEARALFTQAWEMAKNDYEACVAAHFLARQQETPEDTLRWNQEALKRAEAVGDESVQSFYPSLYLNLGHSYEVLSDQAEARRYYELAAAKTTDLPAGRYGDVVKDGIAKGRERIKSAAE
jgi:tetratricopeptide (TPR) repeat protein